jgi:predicted DNA-binding protein (UPF0251 family)
MLGHAQEEAGEMMGVSRGTIWRLLQEVKKKTAKALTEGRGIRIMSDNEKTDQRVGPRNLLTV